MRGCFALLLSALAMAAICRADEADQFFGMDKIHEIRIYFDDPDWHAKLVAAHRYDPTDPKELKDALEEIKELLVTRLLSTEQA